MSIYTHIYYIYSTIITTLPSQQQQQKPYTRVLYAHTSYTCELVVGLSTCLVQATLADVPHPLHHIVITVIQLGLKNFQVADFQARAGKRDLDNNIGTLHHSTLHHSTLRHSTLLSSKIFFCSCIYIIYIIIL